MEMARYMLHENDMPKHNNISSNPTSFEGFDRGNSF